MLVEEFHPKKIELGKVEDRSIKFYYPHETQEGKFRNIKFQIPKMKIAFDPDDKKTSKGKLFVRNISLTTRKIGNEKNIQRIEIFKHKIEKLERYIKKKLPPHILAGKTFCSSLWQGANKNFDPVFKVSIPFNDDGATSGFFDKDDNPVEYTKLAKGQTVSVSVKLTKVWVWKDKIGVNWEIVQAKIYDDETTIPSEIAPSNGSVVKTKFRIIKDD